MDQIPLKKERTWSLILCGAILLSLFLFNVIPHGQSADYPCCFEGYDGWYFVALTEDLVDGGSMWKYPAYLSLDESEGLYHFQPPLFRALAAYTSKLLSLPTFFTTYYLSWVLFLLTILFMFLFIRKNSRNLAYNAIPFFILSFYIPYFYVFKEGQFSDIGGNFIFVLALFCFYNLIRKKASCVKYGIYSFLFFTLLILTHTEHIYLAAILGSYLLMSWLVTKDKAHLKTLATVTGGGLLAVLVTLPLIIRQSLLHASVNNFFDNYHVTKLLGVDVWSWYGAAGLFSAILFVVGLGIFLRELLQSYKKKKELDFLIVSTLVLFVMHVVLMAVKHYRGFDTLQFFPLYFAPFFAAGLVKTTQFLFGQKKSFYQEYVPVVLCALFLIGLLVNNHNLYMDAKDRPPKYTQGEWNAVKWIQEKTPKNAEVLYLYPLNEKPSTFYWMGKRKSYYGAFIDVMDAGVSLNEFEFPETKKNLDFGYRKTGFLKYEEKKSFSNTTLCDVDYIFLSPASSGATFCDPYLAAVPSLFLDASAFNVEYNSKEAIIFSPNENCA